MSDEDMQFYRRDLPHLRIVNAVYFVTWRLLRSQGRLTNQERTLVASVLGHFHGEKYDLIAYVVMDDHVHVLVHPHHKQFLQDILHSWKSYSTNEMQRKFGRKGRIWQEEYFDRVVRNNDELIEKATYIQNNPFKRWPELAHYPWVRILESPDFG